jgi:hypothetical protein
VDSALIGRQGFGVANAEGVKGWDP